MRFLQSRALATKTATPPSSFPISHCPLCRLPPAEHQGGVSATWTGAPSLHLACSSTTNCLPFTDDPPKLSRTLLLRLWPSDQCLPRHRGACQACRIPNPLQSPYSSHALLVWMMELILVQNFPSLNYHPDSVHCTLNLF